MNILGHRLLVVTRHRLGRLAKPAQVRRDYGMTLCQLSDQWPPHMTILGIAVQQNYWIAFSGDQIVKPDSANGCEAVLNRGPRLGPNDCGCGQTKDENCGGSQ